jgi:hypothetical protein|tara:strand:+ start:629 stop:868 length:240 start_codon:yes stop_codon:yes gene_type:complete
MSDKQNQVTDIWQRYLKNLSRLNNALDENARLKIQLAEKPKEVEKIVEVEANVDLEMPDDIAQLEAQVEQKLADNEQTE